MSVIFEAPVFIKSSFSEEKTPEKYKDFELVYGENAFASLQDLQDALSSEEYVGDFISITLLDSKTIIDDEVTVKVPIWADASTGNANTPAVRGTLNIIGQSIDNELTINNESTINNKLTINNELKYFKTLTVDNANINTAVALQEKYTEGTSAESGKINATGKVTVTNNAAAAKLIGYATVVVSENGRVDKITSGATETFSNKKGVVTEKTANAGTVTVTDSSVNEISDYKTVTLKNATLGSALSAVNQTITKEDDEITKITVSCNGAFKATDSAITGNITNFNSVTLTNTFAQGSFNYYAADPSKSDSKSVQYNASGSFKVTVDKKADMENTYSIGSDDKESVIKGYKSVTITGYNDKKGLVKTIDVYADITGGKLAGKNGVASDGTFKATFANINGTINNYKTVTLTNCNVKGAVTGGKADDSNTFSDGTFTFKLDKYAENPTYELSDVKYFKTVNLTGSTAGGIKTGDIIGGNIENTENTETAAVGTVTLKDDITVDGNISGFKTVTMTEAEVSGEINCYGLKGSAVNMTDVEAGAVAGVQKLNIKKGLNFIGAYTGTELNDTLTVNKNTILGVQNSIDFGDGGKDKLVVNGTLLLSKVEAINNCETISGSGEIAAVSSVMNDLKENLEGTNTGKVKLLDLGATSEFFAGSKNEASDDTARKAKEFDFEDGELDGWLSGGENGIFEDLIDYVEFENAGTIGIFDDATDAAASNITVVINGIVQDKDFNIAAFNVEEGDVIGLNRDVDTGSISYYIKTV